MSSSNEKMARQVGQALTDDLTAEEKSEMWNAIAYSRGFSPSSQKPGNARRSGVFRNIGLSGSVMAGVVVAFLFIAGVLTHSWTGMSAPLTEGSGTTVAVNSSSPNSFLVTHLNIIYIAVSIFLFVLSAWGSSCLLMPEQKLNGWIARVWQIVPGRHLLKRIRGLRRWIVSGVFIAVVILSGLELVDQWQGGPLGRENSVTGGNEGVTLAVGQSQWLEAPIQDRAGLSVHILSVTTASIPRGLPIEIGIIKWGTSGADVQKLSTLSPKAITQRFLRRTVTMHKETDFMPILVVKGTQPGDFYKINGYTIVYRWGPIFYRAKINDGFTVRVKIS